MLKSKFLYVILALILLICLAFDIVLDDNISYLAIAYFITFISLSIFLTLRGLIFKIDSNLYFGLLLTMSPIIQCLIYFNITRYTIYLITIFAVLTISSLVIWKYFKDKMHKMLFFIFLGEIGIFFVPFYLTNLSFWYLIIMAIVWLCIVVGVKVYTRNKQTKKS